MWKEEGQPRSPEPDVVPQEVAVEAGGGQKEEQDGVQESKPTGEEQSTAARPSQFRRSRLTSAEPTDRPTRGGVRTPRAPPPSARSSLSSGRLSSARPVPQDMKGSAREHERMLSLREQFESELWRLVPDGWDVEQVRTHTQKPDEQARKTTWKMTRLPDPANPPAVEPLPALVRTVGGPSFSIPKPPKPQPKQPPKKKDPPPTRIPGGHGMWVSPDSTDYNELRSHLSSGCVIETIDNPTTPDRVFNTDNSGVRLAMVTKIGIGSPPLRIIWLNADKDNVDTWQVVVGTKGFDKLKGTLPWDMDHIWNVKADGQWLPPDPNSSGLQRWQQSGKLILPPKDNPPLK